MPVAVEVGHVHPHRALRFAAFIIRHTSKKADLDKMTAIVAKEKIRRSVITLKKIGVAVEVVIEKYRAQLAAFDIEQPRRCRYVDEAPGPVVAKEEVPPPRILRRRQVSPRPLQPARRPKILLSKRELEIIGHIQIQVPIQIVIDKRRPRRPTLVLP